MIDLATARPSTSLIQQWWVLVVRLITPTLRNGELATQVAASIVFTVGFYIPLKKIMGNFIEGFSSYAQYLMPMIAIQAIAFAGISSAFRSATDKVQGIDRRFKAMPIGPLTPLAARMSASLYRCATALTVSLVCGHVIGFRFYGCWKQIVSFCLLILLIGAALALIGDLIGIAAKTPEATTPILLVPQLILGLVSVGLQPVDRFPRWIQGFVRDQPTSQYVYALHALAGDSTPAAGVVTWSVIQPAVVWPIAVIAVLLPLHVVVSSRRR